MIRVAINGFGRIGRMILRAGINDAEIEWVAINDLTDSKTLAHLFKYDSIYRTFTGTISYDNESMMINDKRILVLSEKDPEKLPWGKMDIDVVIESTGFFIDRNGSEKHIIAGARKVVISAPAKNPDITIVKGVNEHLFDKNKHDIISNASCTTNCLAPIVKVLNDNFGVEHGFMTTCHAYTADQRLVDAPHRDLRRARHAAVSIIPTSTGAAKTVAEVIPELKGKLDGIALRIQSPAGSITDFVCKLKKNTTINEINNLFRDVSQYHLKGIIEYTEDPIVSADIIGNSHSVIFDALSTNVIDGNFVKILGWYDNEWGYSCRIIDVVKIVGK